MATLMNALHLVAFAGVGRLFIWSDMSNKG